MPKRPVRHKRRMNQLGESQKMFLLTGWALDADKYYPENGRMQFPFADEDHHRAVWEANRADILREFIVQHPGTRPAAWWTFEAPEDRAFTCGSIEPADDVRFFGMIALEKQRHGPWAYESQFAYLARLGLLFPGEEARCVELNATGPEENWK